MPALGTAVLRAQHHMPRQIGPDAAMRRDSRRPRVGFVTCGFQDRIYRLHLWFQVLHLSSFFRFHLSKNTALMVGLSACLISQFFNLAY